MSQPIGPSEPLPQPSSFKAPERTSYLGLERAFKANLARLTHGITPAGLGRAYFDWVTHLMLAPGKQLQLVGKAGRKATRLAIYAANAAADPETPPCIDPLALTFLVIEFGLPRQSRFVKDWLSSVSLTA
jgi:polyhydroxyalkanoate synthase subunit PhaC